MLRRARNGEEQWLIIPILFYHGEETWEYRPLSGFFEGLGEPFRRYLPSFDYLYHNFQACRTRRSQGCPTACWRRPCSS